MGYFGLNERFANGRNVWSDQGKRVTYHDTIQTGWRFRITHTGSKTYIVRCRINGAPEAMLRELENYYLVWFFLNFNRNRVMVAVTTYIMAWSTRSTKPARFAIFHNAGWWKYLCARERETSAVAKEIFVDQKLIQHIPGAKVISSSIVCQQIPHAVVQIRFFGAFARYSFRVSGRKGVLAHWAVKWLIVKIAHHQNCAAFISVCRYSTHPVG